MNTIFCKILFVFIVVINIFLFGQQKVKNNTISMNDPKAGKILVEIRNKLANYKSYKIDFSFEYKDIKESKPQTIACSYFSAEPKFKLLMQDKDVFCDGHTIWTYSPLNKEVQINHYKGQNKFESPISLIQNFEKEYFYHFKENEIVKKNQVVIELTPIDKKKPIFKIDLVIDTEKKFLLYSKIYEKSGVRQIFKINQIQENIIFKDSEFVFNPSNYAKDIEIVDLR